MTISDQTMCGSLVRRRRHYGTKTKDTTCSRELTIQVEPFLPSLSHGSLGSLKRPNDRHSTGPCSEFRPSTSTLQTLNRVKRRKLTEDGAHFLAAQPGEVPANENLVEVRKRLEHCTCARSRSRIPCRLACVLQCYELKYFREFS